MEQTAAASQRIDQLLAEPIDWGDHCFSYAHVCLMRAACQVASGNGRSAKKLLIKVCSLLDSLQEWCIGIDMPEAPGVLDLRGVWWAVEAERCRLVGDHKAELQAFRESLKLVEQLANDDPISVVHAEYTVMRRLLALAAACDRQGLAEEAAEHRILADEICVRRKFPHTTKRIFSLQPEKPLSTWQRFLNRF